MLTPMTLFLRKQNRFLFVNANNTFAKIINTGFW